MADGEMPIVFDVSSDSDEDEPMGDPPEQDPLINLYVLGLPVALLQLLYFGRLTVKDPLLNVLTQMLIYHVFAGCGTSSWC